MLRDSITIQAPIERVWTVLATPANLPKWNSHAVSVSGGESMVQEGSQFWVRYRLGARETDCRAEVTRLVPMSRLEFTVTSDAMSSTASVTEAYELAANHGGVRVTQKIHLSRSGMPWWGMLLITVIQSIGRPTGKRFLEQLKELIETDAASPSVPSH
jgi:uncharacterized protein YndB with AHSA1/START domain